MGLPFSEITVGLLREAGWTTNRDVPTTAHEQALKAGGYQVFPVVRDFLRQFGGLQISRKFVWNRVPLVSKFHFDARIAVGAWSPEFIKSFESSERGPLCVIGETEFGDSVLLMDEQGRLYSGTDEYLTLVGNSGYDAVEALCTGRKYRKIP